MNEKEYAALIKRVANAYAAAAGADKVQRELAVFILENYYGCETFFLNRENDLTSGLSLVSLRVFVENMAAVLAAINGERG